MYPKLLFVIDQLEIGGAGRVASILINELSLRDYNISIITAIKHHRINYALPNTVSIREWYDPEPIKHNIFGKISNMYNRYKYFRKALNEVKPDVIIAFTHNIFLYTKLWSWGYNVPIIASDHTSMGRDLGRITNYIRTNFYKHADIVTILTKKDEQVLGNRLPNKVIVYNPVTFDVFNGDTLRENIVLCVGRKTDWSVKGFDRIIQIWGELYHKYPNWKLEIVGASNSICDAQLMKMIEDAGVADGVILKGNTKEIEQVYRSAKIFALPSRVEGFPLVLVEAMSQGCACISFSMQRAVSEIITDGVDGIIVEDGDLRLFAAKLEELMTDLDKQQKYANNAKQTVARFSIKSFVDQWEQLLNKVLQ